MQNYHSNKKQSAMITMHIAHRWKGTEFGVLQGTVLGPTHITY